MFQKIKELKEMRKIILLISCVLLPLLLGAIAGIITSQQIAGWYVNLNKPAFNPPNYLFGPVWTTLYISMGVSLFMIINQKINTSKKMAYIFYAMQLVLNFFWSIIFFHFHNVGFALVEIIVMWLGIAGTVYHFYSINKTAALLNIPYLAWVSFASVLNASIYYLN